MGGECRRGDERGGEGRGRGMGGECRRGDERGGEGRGEEGREKRWEEKKRRGKGIGGGGGIRKNGQQERRKGDKGQNLKPFDLCIILSVLPTRALLATCLSSLSLSFTGSPEDDVPAV